MQARRHGLARQRKAAGYSQEELAERLGVERSTVVRWEAGDTEPQPGLRPKIARALRVSLAQLDELLAGDRDTDVERPDDRQPPTGVGFVTVAQLRSDVQQLDEQYDHLPSAALLAKAGQCLGQVAVLNGHVTRGRVRRDLCVVEAEAATLMGQLVWDASQRRDHTAARGYFDQAIVAARHVHDPIAEGFALLRKSYVALYGEREPQEGLSLTEQAAHATIGSSSVLAGLATLHSAEAHAMLGRLRDCEQALGRAETFFTRVTRADPAIDLFSPTQFGRLAGSCYLFLGKAERAQPILEDTAASARDRSKSRAIVLGNLALAYLRQEKLDAATSTLHQAIDLVQLNWGGGGLTVVFTAGRELRRHRQVQEVREVCDRLLGLMAAA